MSEAIPSGQKPTQPIVPQAATPPQGTPQIHDSARVQGAVSAQGTLSVFEPGTGKLLGEVRVATSQDVRETVRQARTAQAE